MHTRNRKDNKYYDNHQEMVLLKMATHKLYDIDAIAKSTNEFRSQFSFISHDSEDKNRSRNGTNERHDCKDNIAELEEELKEEEVEKKENENSFEDENEEEDYYHNRHLYYHRKQIIKNRKNDLSDVRKLTDQQNHNYDNHQNDLHSPPLSSINPLPTITITNKSKITDKKDKRKTGKGGAIGLHLPYESAILTLKTFHSLHGHLVIPRRYTIQPSSSQSDLYPKEWHSIDIASTVYNMKWWSKCKLISNCGSDLI